MQSIRAVVLCGGKGTRAYPATAETPKPMLRVGAEPVLRHVLDIYAAHGCRSFVLATGHLGHVIGDWAQTLPTDWEVEVVDTGAETGTGERLRRCRELVGDVFFATYGDGVGDVDMPALLDFHLGHGGLATVTTVPLPSQYGTLEIDERTGAVRRFVEKPVLSDHWINAGFFVLHQAAFDAWDGPDLERNVLPGLGARGQLYAYRHTGFWKSMDTHKDQAELTRLAEERGNPWLPKPS